MHFVSVNVDLSGGHCGSLGRIEQNRGKTEGWRSLVKPLILILLAVKARNVPIQRSC
jgi:hypothetical protein